MYLNKVHKCKLIFYAVDTYENTQQSYVLQTGHGSQ